jgi:hypothetical protein
LGLPNEAWLNLLNEIGKFVAPNDPVLVEKTLTRLEEQDTWNDVFSTKLIELLDNVDAIKIETRAKLRSLEELAAQSQSELASAQSATRLARLAVPVVALCLGLSWIATTWALWIALRPLPLWIPSSVSLAIAVVCLTLVLKHRRAG